MMLTENGAEPFTCDNTPHWGQLGPTIKVEKGEGDLNFAAARIIADAEAATRCSLPGMRPGRVSSPSRLTAAAPRKNPDGSFTRRAEVVKFKSL